MLKEAETGDVAYNDAIASEGVRLVAQRLDEQTMESGLNGEPGEYLSYCNDGFGLLSDVIRRYGKEPSYGDYLVRHILKPLGMERSFCDFVTLRLAVSFQKGESGSGQLPYLLSGEYVYRS